MLPFRGDEAICLVLVLASLAPSSDLRFAPATFSHEGEKGNRGATI